MTRLALLVDDSRSMRSILARLLASLGWDSVQAADGRAALDLLAEGCRPDAALVDWNMPVMNGLELVAAMRSEPHLSALPIVMVTSESELAQISAALTAGADEYLVKPFTADALAQKLELLPEVHA
jgi:two-component system chemotaxis response regulator CheY